MNRLKSTLKNLTKIKPFMSRKKWFHSRKRRISRKEKMLPLKKKFKQTKLNSNNLTIVKILAISKKVNNRQENPQARSYKNSNQK